MEVVITAKPRFRIPLTGREAEMLVILSMAHYDSRCKAASAKDGFLTRWSTRVNHDFYKEIDAQEGVVEGVTPIIDTSWDELDTVLKITEGVNYIGFEAMIPCGMNLHARLRKLLQTYTSDFYPKWQATVEV